MKTKIQKENTRYPKNLCLNIRYIRKINHLSMAQMAKKLHISIFTLLSLEFGHIPADLTVEIINPLQQEFGLHPSRIFTPLYQA